MDTAILSLKNLTFCRNEKPIFEPITFDVFQGDVVHVKGKNGSGKTTTLRMILRIFQPDQGDVVVLGNPTGKTADDRLGYLPEEPHPLPFAG